MPDRPHIVICSENPLITRLCETILRRQGYGISPTPPATNGGTAEVILLDLCGAGGAGLQQLIALREALPNTPVIVVTDHPTSRNAIDAIRQGAYDFISKAILQEELLNTVAKAIDWGRLTRENARLRARLHARDQELALLSETAQLFSSPLPLDEVLRRVIKQMKELLQAEAISLRFVEEEAGQLMSTMTCKEGADATTGVVRTPGEDLAGWVASHTEPAPIPDATADRRCQNLLDGLEEFATRSVLCVPIRARGEVIGVIEAMNPAPERPFTTHDLNLLTAVAAQVSIGINHARASGRPAETTASISQ